MDRTAVAKEDGWLIVRIGTRKLLDRSFSGLGFFSILLMGLSVMIILVPIITRGLGAVVFKGTVEFRRMQLEKFERGNREAIDAEIASAIAARKPIYDTIGVFESEMDSMKITDKLKYRKMLRDVTEFIEVLLGPFPGSARPVLPREQYGQTRWDRAQVKLHQVIYRTEYDYSDPTKMGTKVFIPRAHDFAGTSLADLFPYLEEHIEEMLLPRRTLYLRFLSDVSVDSHIFGGIRAEVLGTLFLAIGAMLFALPMGVLSAIYLIEYSQEGRIISFLRTCVSTLAGVPSIVFALFGLAFFINTMQVTHSKSVLAGSLTLACLILPTVIRASEEALRAVPQTYREAALSLGAGKWRTVVTVVLPSALPGILTGTMISLGRAAGETAPIIFTAAVSVGAPLSLLKPKFWDVLSQPTPALPWNIYNLCTEHEAVDEIRHVQYGMVLALVVLVLALNAAAIIMRARISRKLRG